MRFTAITRFQSSSLVSSIAFAGEMMPALLNPTSIPPNVSITSAWAASTDRAVGHVHVVSDHLGTEVPKLAFGIGERVRVPIENRHPRSLAGEGDRAGAPDPGPAATHHDRFAGQLEIHPYSS